MIGSGILKGMAVTAKNFVGSYFDEERLTTVQYPEERNPLPENYRNFPFLVYDGQDSQAGLRCVACKICEKECPPQCIYIVKSDDKKPDYLGKPQFYPKVFDIDISVCMSCQICVEVCPFEAIKMDKVFELSQRERFDALLLRRDQLAKSNSYYHEIHPIEAAAVDKNLSEAAAAAEAKKKAAAQAGTAKAAAAKGTPSEPKSTTSAPSPAPTPIASPESAAGSTSAPGEAPPASTSNRTGTPPAQSDVTPSAS
jgi:NADH-quinone oxidoreductase subunit I